MSKSHTLILYNEGENITEQRETFKNSVNEIKEIPSLSLQKIAPVLILDQEKNKDLLHPFVKIENPEVISLISKKGVIEEKNLELSYKIINSYDDNLVKDLSTISKGEILKANNSEEERRNLDKINLFKGFYYAYDHQGSIKFDCNEEAKDCEFEFYSINQNLKNFFDVEV